MKISMCNNCFFFFENHGCCPICGSGNVTQDEDFDDEREDEGEQIHA